jgi:hypothetical protein
MLRKIIIPLTFVLILSACGSSSVTREQLAEVSVRVFNHPYETAYDASLAAIRDQGFEIVIDDRNSGNIEGFYDLSPEIQRRDISTRSDRQTFFVGYDPNTAVAMILGATIERRDENSSRVTLRILEEIPAQAGSGYARATTENTRRPVRKIELYEGMFEDILRRMN